MVELMTKIKALPGDSPDYHLFISLDEGTTTEGNLNSIHLKFYKLQVWGRYVSTPK